MGSSPTGPTCVMSQASDGTSMPYFAAQPRRRAADRRAAVLMAATTSGMAATRYTPQPARVPTKTASINDEAVSVAIRGAGPAAGTPAHAGPLAPEPGA